MTMSTEGQSIVSVEDTSMLKDLKKAIGMMKQIVLSLLLALLPLIASADAVEINGIYYNLVSKLKTAEVTKNPNKYRGNIDIPASVEYEGTTYSVTSIGSAAFYSCTGLTSITIPNSMTSIGENAFAFCTGLKEVYISDLAAWCNISLYDYLSSPLYYAGHLFLNGVEITELTIPNSVTSIGGYAFCGCKGLTSITIPNSVTSIGASAFRGCSGLTSITIPNSVTSIEMYTFCNCTGLTSVTIGNSVTSIGWYAFKGCKGLTSITIPNSVTSIGNEAFFGCSSLTSITIGSGIKTIRESAFAKCSELTDVYCDAESVPSTNATAFTDSYIEYATLHVPELALEAYKTTAPWSSFKSFVSLENDDQLYDMTINVGSAFGKVTYGTADVTNGQQTFNVKGSEEVVLTLTPNDGFKVSHVTVNGEDRTADVVNGQFALGKLTANTTVSISFGVAGEFVEVTIGSDKIATFCTAGDVDFTSVEGVKAYIGSIFNRQTGSLTLTRAYDVPAGTGLLIKGEPGTYEIPYSQSFSITSNLLKGVMTATNISATEDGYANYILGSGSKGVGFYKVGAEGTMVAAGHAYLQIPASSPAASRSAVSLWFDDEDEATGVDDAARLNNKDEIINNSVLFDLQGRRVEKPQRGVYIRDGKKVVVK